MDLIGSGKSGPDAVPEADLIKNATSASFAKDVIEASRDAIVIVDFWAPWCGPCKQLTPIIEKVVRSYGGKVRLVKINVDENQAVAAQLRIQSLPTVYAFRDGRPLDGFVGGQGEAAVREFIDRLAGAETETDIAAVLLTGEELLEQGDLQGAAEVFASILEVETDNPVALAGLAGCYLASGDAERAEQTLALVPPDKQSAPAVQSLIAKLDLARKAAGAGDLSQLANTVAADGADHQARYDYAVALAASDQKSEALEQLLEIVRRDRSWNDDAARKQLLQLFDAWGNKEPVVAEGRRRLSTLLFR